MSSKTERKYAIKTLSALLRVLSIGREKEKDEFLLGMRCLLSLGVTMKEIETAISKELTEEERRLGAELINLRLIDEFTKFDNLAN